MKKIFLFIIIAAVGLLILGGINKSGNFIKNGILVANATGTVTVSASVGTSVACTSATSTTDFSVLTTSAIFTSTPSVTSTMSCNYGAGCTLSVNDLYAGLYNSTSTGYTIPSPAIGNPATTTMATSTEGFGVQAATSSAGSGGVLSINQRYLWTGIVVGGLTTSTQVLATSSQAISGREVTVAHKAAISGLTWAGTYADTITYGCTGN